MKILMGFDLPAKDIVLVQAEKTTLKEERLHFTAPVFTDIFFSQASELLSKFVKQKPALRGKTAYVVLPNESIGFETFDFPNMSRAKTEQALEAELNNLYEGRQKTQKVNKFFIRKGKEYSTYGAFLAERAILEGLNKILTSARLVPAAITYSGNALLNSAYAYMPKTRGKSFVFADVRQKQTEIALSAHGKTLGYAAVPHGSKLLEAEEVLSEYMITDHEAGELAVINARESARAKSLTVAEDFTDTDDEDELTEGDVSGESADAEEIAETGETDAVAGIPAAKAKVYRKMPKRYPKYMLRPLPETTEGVRFENFRILQKWLLLYARQMRMTEYAAAPEYILVNMPKEYYGLLDTANAGQAEGPKFLPFTATDGLGAVKEHLSLCGAMFAKKFNRDGNF